MPGSCSTIRASIRRSDAPSSSTRSAGRGLYLLSDLSSGVTGEIHFVDSGYNIISMPKPDALKEAAEAPKKKLPDAAQ